MVRAEFFYSPDEKEKLAGNLTETCVQKLMKSKPSYEKKGNCEFLGATYTVLPVRDKRQDKLHIVFFVAAWKVGRVSSNSVNVQLRT
ncbi:hypothetical protein DXN04_00295 [Chitinophaga silvisoli]|uniref:Uncharacterized protein n=1 Tax=Chitinophaga silvisoli TaxID=2291814 RepID=A0A3E1P722_9BACT|nr:hypothetical protein DXN04_00295 [Chitinophaga silvisoli]